MLVLRTTAIVIALISGCAAVPVGGEGDDLALGEVGPDDNKADGRWGYATECKPIPEVEPLIDPAITLSIDGLTLHLVDRAGGYDAVFPVGVGTIDERASSSISGQSETYFPIHETRRQDFEIDTTDAWSFNPCRVWWTDPDTTEMLPVFAGLPFMRFFGSYGIHGPITGYREPDGGHLVRGYVSHGCVRMEAAHVLEVYSRTSGVDGVPVHLQREPERRPDGRRVDVTDRWIGSECDVDTDCGFEAAVCEIHPSGGHGFCSLPCARLCPDRPGYPMTACVASTTIPNSGMCVPREERKNRGCRPYDRFVPRFQRRFGASGAAVPVCVPQ